MPVEFRARPRPISRVRPGRSIDCAPPRSRDTKALAFALLSLGLVVRSVAGWQQDPAQKDPKPEAAAPATGAPENARRIELNLLGKTDAAAGESRRNENIQFNLVDNNALKELNVRLGATATIIEIFRPERGYFSSEFGNPPGAILFLPAANRSGIHGTLYVTHRNSIFSARSFFQVGGVEPAHDNEYGFTFTAPVWRGAQVLLEGGQARMRGSVNGNVLVPLPDERTPLTADPATRAIVERFLDAYKMELPNRTDINPRALNTNSPQRIDDDNGGIRLDQQLRSRDRVGVRYQFTAQHLLPFELVLGQNPDTNTKAHTARFTWERSWSVRTTSSLSAGFDRIRSLLVPDAGAVGPMVSITGLTTLGPLAGIPIDRAQNMFRYGGQVRHSSGKHQWTGGFNLLRRQLNGYETDTHRGYFSFANDFGRDSITNLRMGAPSQNIQATGNVSRGFRNWDMQYYAGDTWQAYPKLTLNLGLRYTPVTKPTEVNSFERIPYPCDCNNLAPLFGFAYRLPERWGVLRGGYSIQYGEIYPVTFQQVRFDPPWNSKVVVPSPDLVNPQAALTQQGAAPDARTTVYELSPSLVTPYEHSYNFSWERTLPGEWHVQAGYVGSRAHKLLSMWYLNRAEPVQGIPQTTATLNARRADQSIADYRLVLNGSDAYYDAARVSLVLPRRHNLSMDISYWFSKALDLGSSYTNTAYDADSRLGRSQSEFDTHKDMKGLSEFDQPHAFLWHLSYTTPAVSRVFGGWTITAITLLKNGTPFTVVSGSDAPGFGNVDGNGGDRPNLLDPFILGTTIGNPDTSRQLLRASAFAFIHPTDAAGNLGRNTFRRGGIHNVNASLLRVWTLRSEIRLTFRAESINLSNTPQFAEPGVELSSPNFGQITNTLNDGRTFRLGLVFAF